jgi:hypothetical protein
LSPFNCGTFRHDASSLLPRSSIQVPHHGLGNISVPTGGVGTRTNSSNCEYTIPQALRRLSDNFEYESRRACCCPVIVKKCYKVFTFVEYFPTVKDV